MRDIFDPKRIEYGHMRPLTQNNQPQSTIHNHDHFEARNDPKITTSKIFEKLT
jgi:hypothetical protein